MPFHEGTITNWRKKEGDLMTPGEVLVEIETCYTKTKQEFQYYDASPGYLAKILVPENSGKVELNRVGNSFYHLIL